MGKLEGLYPQEVFGAFEEICGIPHGSYNIDAISDHLKSYAEAQGFECIQDKEKNIIVRMPASEGYEDEPESMKWVSQYANANLVKTDFFEARSTAYAKSSALVDDL